jgi:hypothetical protein
MNSNLQLCLDFLTLVRLVEPSTVVETTDGFTYITSCISSIRKIILETVEDIVNLSRHLLASDEVLLIVCKDYQHCKKLLLYNNQCILSLMVQNILLVHKADMMCLLKNRLNYSIVCCEYVNNEVLDRRRVINICTNTSTAYDSMLVSKCCHKSKHKHILYHVLVESLDILGVEYAFILFKSSCLLHIRLNTVLYIIKSDKLVNIVRLS